jgi:magnesium transporter
MDHSIRKYHFEVRQGGRAVPAVQTFYLSRILGNKVLNGQNQLEGKLLDLVVDVTAVRPLVIAAKIKMGNKKMIVDFSSFLITKKNNQYSIQCKSLIEKEIPSENTLFLVKHILDKQIVDMDGRKVVRVNDLRLAVLSNGIYLLAVDIGFEGLLRRLGVAKPLKHTLKPLGVTIPSRFLLWEEVETIDFFRQGIKLSKSYMKLDTLHPSDLADILEDLDRTSQLAVFSSLEAEKAADVLEELVIEAQLNVIENLSADDAAGMLGKMPTDEVADILEEMDVEQANEILSRMDQDSSLEVRELMGYPEKSVGSLMTTEFISFPEDITVNDAMEELRRLKPDPEYVNNLFIVDEHDHLISHFSLGDLVLADPKVRLNQIINRDLIYVRDDEEIEDLNEIIEKYNLLGVPVVDDDMTLIGMVHINDVVHNLLKARRRRR